MRNATFALILLCFSLFSTPAFTHAQGIGSDGTVIDSNGSVVTSPQIIRDQSRFVPLAPIPGLTTGIVADSAGTTGFLNNLYKYLIGIAAVLAIIEIIWAGMEIATKDSVSSKSDGKKRIWQALMGLALVLSPALVFGIINPAILNMSISMPALDLHKYGGYTPSTAPKLNGTKDYTLEGTTNVGGAPTGQIGSVTINKPSNTASAGDPSFDAYIKQKRDYVAQCTNATTGGTYQETTISGGTQLRMDCTIPLSGKKTNNQQQTKDPASAPTAPTPTEINNSVLVSGVSYIAPGSSCSSVTDTNGLTMYQCWNSAATCAAAVAPNSSVQQSWAINHYTGSACKQY